MGSATEHGRGVPQAGSSATGVQPGTAGGKTRTIRPRGRRGRRDRHSVEEEFEKRARFLPIRSLMGKAGHAIQSIKPVFMMSPLSIANYLPPGALTFDLIVFDEASQVRPVDALGAIARGQQVVVVGDSKQLPPPIFSTRWSQQTTPRRRMNPLRPLTSKACWASSALGGASAHASLALSQPARIVDYGIESPVLPGQAGGLS